ncbi:glycosyltransferase family 2 protein [Candidatus Curtissbacteria bacterium]|nr:glycosyltransferase family 2 protein [Candidatus Curtissbacteria bacterium]
MSVDLSVIIVNWNTKKLLEDCLSSIFKFTKGISFEVIVVDNGSTDGSRAMVKKKFPQVTLVSNKENLGFTKANNQGIKVAKGKYILLLNSDTYLIENSFPKLVAKARRLKGSTLSRVEPLGALGPLLLGEDQSIQQSVGFFPYLPQIFWWMTFIDDLPGGTILKPYHVDHNSFYRQDRKVDWVTGAAILVPKSVINRVGPLDEKIFMYGEEVEWCYRIKKAGYSICFSPVTKIIHIGRGSQKIPTKSFIGEYQGIIYFYQKYKGRRSLQIARLLLKMGALLRVGVFAILGRKELVNAYVQAFKVV